MGPRRSLKQLILKHTYKLLTLACLLIGQSLAAQSNLDSLLETTQPPSRQYVTGTFKGTRVINLQSVEKIGPGALQFIIQHRFGPINGGAYQLFGLDQSTIRFGLEYGLSKRFAIGFGRSSYEKTYDAYIKANLVRQSTGSGSFPLSIVYFGSSALKTLHFSDTAAHNFFSSRMVFTHQLIIASKISDRLSLEVVPTFIHRNLVQGKNEPNDWFAVGFGGRLKLTKRTSLNVEYVYRIPPKDEQIPSYAAFYNSLSVGFDIETGGHVFQFHLTNSLPMLEKGFITETGESWKDGGIHLGFNISRDFSFKHKKK